MAAARVFTRTKERIRLQSGTLTRDWRIVENQLLPETAAGAENRKNRAPACLSFAGLTTDYYNELSTLTYAGLREMRPASAPFMADHHLSSLQFHDTLRNTELEWKFRCFQDTAGVESWVEFTTDAMPLGNWRDGDREDRLDVIPVDTLRSRFYLTSFQAVTDYHNEFVKDSVHHYTGEKPLFLDGNILRIESAAENGLIIIKMTNGPSDRREKIRSNFRIEPGLVTVLGWGIEPQEITPGETISSHSVVMVPYSGGAFGAHRALRQFWSRRWLHSWNVPPTVMVNPWGGGGQYLRDNLSDAFMADELSAARLARATHYQIDDGWQAGNIVETWIRGMPASPGFWAVHAKKFPNGFQSLKKNAARNCVGLGLWTCPNVNIQYADWRKEADLFSEFHRRYGFEFFKVDGVMHRTRKAEINLDRFLTRMFDKTNRRIYFNLDVTNGVRLGFLHAPQYGPLFPANRSPFSRRLDANKYRPEMTLRNFWLLARHIPAHLIQVEVPDIFFKPEEFGNPKKIGYACTDPHHPLKYGAAYCAAISLFGAPLLWLQPSRTDRMLLEEYGKMMAHYHEHHERMKDGHVLPIGAVPNGKSVTGFASIRTDGGYALVFREAGGPAAATIELPDKVTASLEILDKNAASKATLHNGILKIRFESPRSFAFFKWEKKSNRNTIHR